MPVKKNDSLPEIKAIKQLVASRLLLLRTENGKSLFDVSSITGVSVSALSNYERGARHPDFFSLYKLSEFYNVSVDWLIGRETKRR